MSRVLLWLVLVVIIDGTSCLGLRVMLDPPVVVTADVIPTPSPFQCQYVDPSPTASEVCAYQQMDETVGTHIANSAAESPVDWLECRLAPQQIPNGYLVQEDDGTIRLLKGPRPPDRLYDP